MSVLYRSIAENMLSQGKANVLWVPVTAQSWGWKRVLYLYQNPDGRIFYIGKAYGDTVAERHQAHANEGLITLVPATTPNCLTVLVGIVAPPSGELLTDSLICDVEALLISETNPLRNTAHPAVDRDELEVTCSGSWPLRQTRFVHKRLPPPPGPYLPHLFGGGR